MHIKHMHEMIEKLASCANSEFEKGIECVDTEEMGAVTDMLKDLCEADYYSHIVKAMKEAKEEEKEEEKYMLKRFKEEYGEEDGERRYYDDYRYMRTGRFAPEGRGTYDPRRGGRRGYSEPRYYTMTPDMYREHDPEYYRDMDRHEGRMYYTESGRSSSYSNGSSNRGMTGGNMGGSRYYSGEGEYSVGRDSREGRSGRSRRGYMETKEMRSDNSAESKQHRMKELESYTKELAEDVTEMISDASAEEKSLLKQKLQVLIQKI